MTNYKCFKCEKKISSANLDTRFVCPHCGSKIFYKPRTKPKKLRQYDFSQNKQREVDGQETVGVLQMDQNQKIQELQILEQNFQNLILQKQNFELELSETKSALSEIENSGEEVYKIIGQLLLKSDKEKMKEELSNKEKLLEMRIKAFESQEDSLGQKLGKLREEITGSENR